MAGEDGLVEIHPRELRFLFEEKKKSSCCVNLVNKSDEFVAFKIKTTSPKRYCVRPNIGVILPRGSCDFTVTMQAQKIAPPDLQIKDKFLVQTTVVPFDATDEDTIRSFFSKETGPYIEENKLRVVLVSVTEPQAEEPIVGVPRAETTAEVPVPKEILDNLNGAPNVANEVHHPLRVSYSPLKENPATLSEIASPAKETSSVLENFQVPSKEIPFTMLEPAPSLTETPAVSGESHYSSTETSVILKESALLEDTLSPGQVAISLHKGPNNAESLHLPHQATEDIQNLQSKLNNLEVKLEEAEILIMRLREETRTIIQERDKLRKEMVFLKRAGTTRGQAGFPMLFVIYMAIVGMSVGYLLHL